MDHAGDGRRHIPARGHFSNPRNVDSRGTKDPTFQVRQLDDVTSQRTSCLPPRRISSTSGRGSETDLGAVLDQD